MMIPCDLLILQYLGYLNETAQMNALAVRDDNLFLQYTSVAYVIGVVGHILQIRYKRAMELFIFVFLSFDGWKTPPKYMSNVLIYIYYIWYTPEVNRARTDGKHWCLYPSRSTDPSHSGSNCHSGDCTWPSRFVWCACRWPHTATSLTGWFPSLESVPPAPPRRCPTISSSVHCYGRIEQFCRCVPDWCPHKRLCTLGSADRCGFWKAEKWCQFDDMAGWGWVGCKINASQPQLEHACNASATLTCRPLISWRPNHAWRTPDYRIRGWRPDPSAGANEWNSIRYRATAWCHRHMCRAVARAPSISALAAMRNSTMLALWIFLRERKTNRHKCGEREIERKKTG